MDTLVSLLIPFFVSVAYAYRGGQLGQKSTQIGRLAWFAVWGWVCAYLSLNLTTGLICAIGAYLGMMMPHGRYFTVGFETDPPNKKDWLGWAFNWIGNRTIIDNLAMLVIGTIRSVLLLWPFGVWAVIYGAIVHPVAYNIAWRISRQKAIPYAEYIYGFMLPLFVVIERLINA